MLQNGGTCFLCRHIAHICHLIRKQPCKRNPANKKVKGYPVEDVGPALRGDALVHGEHGEAQVVKVCDAAVGAGPAGSTLRPVDGAATAVSCLSTRRSLLILHRGDNI